MRLIACLTFCLLLVNVYSSDLFVKQTEPKLYESQWAIKLEDGVDPSTLEELGYKVVGPVGNLKNTYVVEHQETFARHQESHSNKLVASPHVTQSLLEHPDVKWAEQQFLRQQKKRAPTDPLYPDQWHLRNTGQFGGVAGNDVNIQGAWDAGFTGQGVRIAIVDDGFQTTHPDLSARYQASSSFSFNAPVGNSPNPDILNDFHGTAAGGVALAADNAVCGVGAAYRAEGAGIRLIAAGTTDATEASGLSYKNQENHIYSNSWGPADDGVDVGGPLALTLQALEDDITNGRGGKGNIFVWAAGNGLPNNDNCNYDGYANSRFTIAVGAIGNNGKQSFYSEPCAAMLVTAPSDSATINAGIRTTDLVGANGYSTTDCAVDFGGTSSACPLVSGIVALVLQANPNLGWRDVQQILARTATKTDPTDSDWTTNQAGLNINHKYGFGRIDATAAVNLAKGWSNFGPEVTTTSGTVNVGATIPDNSATGVSASVTISDNIAVEHVVITVDINHATSGDLAVIVTAPTGTESILATPHADLTALFVNNNGILAGIASFGPAVTFTATTGSLLRATPAIACTAPTNCAQLAGTIAVVTRGTCDYTVKVKNVQNCGAIGAVVINTDNLVIDLGGTDATITIPTVSVASVPGGTITNGQQGSITRTKYQANNYAGGWPFSTVRNLGERSAGTWTVRVIDGFPGATGTFNSVRLDVYGNSSAYSLAPASLFVYLVLAAVMATLALVM